MTTQDITAGTYIADEIAPDVDAANLAANNARYAPITGSVRMSGVGAPNGVMTGSVGDEYRDTAATIGARVWRKASGTATNTGWLVELGNTGWRTVAPENGFTATTLRIMLTQDALFVQCDMNGSGKTDIVFLSLAAGWRGLTPTTYFPLRTGATGVVWGFGGVNSLSVNSTSTTLQGMIMIPRQRESAWPTSFVGTADPT